MALRREKEGKGITSSAAWIKKNLIARLLSILSINGSMQLTTCSIGFNFLCIPIKEKFLTWDHSKYRICPVLETMNITDQSLLT